MSKKLMVYDRTAIRSKPSTDLYRENWDKIFGKKEDKQLKEKDLQDK